MSFSGLTGEWISTELVIKGQSNGWYILDFGVTTGLRAMPAGTYKAITTAATLALEDAGEVITCSVDGTIITLPALASSTHGTNYTIINTAPNGSAAIIVKSGATTNTFTGCGFTTTGLSYQITNTKATAVCGDRVVFGSLCDKLNTTCWMITGLIGTWTSTT